MIEPSSQLRIHEIIVGLLVIAAAATAVILWGPSSDPDLPEPSPASVPSKPIEPKVEPTTVETAPAYKPPSPKGEGILQAGETFSAALESHGLSSLQIHGVVSSIGKLYDFRQTKPGARFSYRLNPSTNALIQLRFEPSPLEIFEVTRDSAGGYLAQTIEVTTTKVEAEIAAEVKTSLWAAIQSTGESPNLYAQLADVFAWDIDFSQNTYSGDRFKLIIEKTLKDDQFIRYGRVLAAEYRGKYGEFRSFWYAPPGRDGGYYLEDGQSARKNFLATPLKYTRISSAFGQRRHPILGFNKQHNGVDFAAPTGTPVWAMGAGTVQFAGMKGANGNLVIITHENGYTSYYAHLHRIQKGIKAGVKVEQKQLIGLVGSTGRSTGPHLHLGLKRNGHYVDPTQVKAIRSHSLSKAEMPAFTAHITALRARLDNMPDNTSAPAAAPDTDTSESTDIDIEVDSENPMSEVPENASFSSDFDESAANDSEAM